MLQLKKFLGEDSRKRLESQRETIPDQRANHREGPALHGIGTNKWDMKEALVSRAEVVGTPSAKGRPTKVSEVGIVDYLVDYKITTIVDYNM